MSLGFVNPMLAQTTAPFCGWDVRSTPVDSSLAEFADRFGNLYTREEITIPIPSAHNIQQNGEKSFSGCGCDEEFMINTGYFDLWFEDCVYTTTGFNDMSLGTLETTIGKERRKVACQVFAEIAQMITLQTGNGCNYDEDRKVNIQIRPHENVAATGAELELPILAEAGPHYFAYTGNAQDGFPWMIINTGEIRPELVVLYHGSVRVNFEDGISWWNDTNQPPPTGFRDLYSVLWHEAMHILGFASVARNPYLYTRFDKSLHLSNYPNGVTLPLMEVVGWDWNYSPGINPGTDFYVGCQDPNVSGPDMEFHSNTGGVYPILADDSTLPMEKSSHSHLKSNCDNSNTADFLMASTISAGERRVITSEEVDILCTLGYQTNTCGCVVSGADDFGISCEDIYEISLCQTLTISVTDLMSNDHNNVTGIDFLDVRDKAHGKVVDNQNGTYTFTPSLLGLTVLSYVPVGCTDSREGNLTNVYVQVVASPSCETTYSCNDLLTCGELAFTYCSLVDNCMPQKSCNLICNSGFCGTTYSNAINNQLPLFNSPYLPLLGNSMIPNWSRTHGTPDVNAVSGNNLYVRIVSSSAKFASTVELVPALSEGFMTTVLMDEGDYFFAFRYDLAPTLSNLATSSLEVNLIEASGIRVPIDVFSSPDYNGAIENIFTLNQPSPSFLIRTGTCFSIGENNLFDALWFTMPAPTTSGHGTAAYIDDVELVPNEFELSSYPTPILCGESEDIGGDFCMLSRVGITYQWYEIINGSAALFFEYTVQDGDVIAMDNNPNFDADTKVLTVFPTEMTTYRLVRSVDPLHDGGLPDLFNECVPTITETTIYVTPNLPDASFTINTAGCMYTFAPTNFANEDIVWMLDGIPVSVDEISGSGAWMTTLSLGAVHTISLTLTNGGCGTDVVVETINVNCTLATCADCVNNTTVTIGADNQTTNLSTLVDYPANGSTDGVIFCVKGDILIDHNYNFTNCVFLMNSGASLIVADGVTLNMAHNYLLGCDQMWRGIEVEEKASLKFIENLVEDAQFAIYIHPHTTGSPFNSGISLDGNIFRNNYVGVFVPETPLGKMGAFWFDQNDFIGTGDLKPTFAGQIASTAIENLPKPLLGDNALAGVVVNNVAGFTSNRNTFTNLVAGMVSNNSTYEVLENVFTGIIPENETTYDGFWARARAISSDSDGTTSLLIKDSDFFNCSEGIHSEHEQFTAKGNTMNNVEKGIYAIASGIGTVTIGGELPSDKNTIDNTRYGIVVGLLFEPTSEVNIINNDISTNAIPGDESYGISIGFIVNEASSLIEKNTITVNGAGSGISSGYSFNGTLNDNTINLTNASLNDAGIIIKAGTNNLLVDNTITGAGLTGDDNIGISVNSSSGNVYCCNTVENTRIGVQFWGDCMSTDNFRGTTFGNHETALLLFDNLLNGVAQTHLGIQNHTENKWEGTLTNISEAQWMDGFDDAQFFPFLVDDNANADFRPDMSLPADWFKSEPNLNPMEVCAEENCSLDGFVSDSPDTKRIAGGQINTGEYASISWELERYLYGKIAGISVIDPMIVSFKSSSQNNTVGKFHDIKSDEKTMFEANAAERTQIVTNLILIDGKLAAMSNIDILLSTATQTTYDNLMANKQQIANEIQVLAAANLALNQTLLTNRALTASSLKVDNSGISVVVNYEQNQKTVNDLYLNFIATEMQNLSQTDISVLQTVALQCPIEGGHAVYSARAFLALVGEDVTYDDTSLCNKEGNKILQKPNTGLLNTAIAKTLKVYPNPAKNNLTIQWEKTDFEKGNLVFYDVFGKQILQQNIESGSNAQVINLQHLQSGLYFIQVKLDDEPPLIQRVVISQ